MDFKKINIKLENEQLTLVPIAQNNREFMNEMFNDRDIKHYYIVPKEAQQDYKKLIDYWLSYNKNETGVCWIISQKGNDIFSIDHKCGFIAFIHSDSLKTARISYAILPNFRKKGIATLATELVIEKLKEQGVLTVEADIDKDNLLSEKVVKKLGFTSNKRHAIIDPEMLRDGEIRIRFLWEKHLIEMNPTINKSKLDINATKEQIILQFDQIVKEIENKGKHKELILRYLYLLGRIKFIERDYEAARPAFGQCNLSIMRNESPVTHLYNYWLGKINKAEGKKELALDSFKQAKTRFNTESTDVTLKDIEDAIKSIE